MIGHTELQGLTSSVNQKKAIAVRSGGYCSPSPFSRVVGLSRAICRLVLGLSEPFETKEFGDLSIRMNIR